MEIEKWYRAARWLYLHHIPILPGIIKGSIRIIWGGRYTISGRYRNKYKIRISGLRRYYS